MMKISCPKCQAERNMSLINSYYSGPYRCWKCRALFTIEIKNGELTSYETLSEEDFKRQQEAKAIQDKLKSQFPAIDKKD